MGSKIIILLDFFSFTILGIILLSSSKVNIFFYTNKVVINKFG